MCLIAFAWGASEQHPFVVAANRDEFLDRPTAPLALWTTPCGAQILSGRDLRDGGTWMGFAPNGRFAMLTNVRQPHSAAPEQPISRGGLALSWLESTLAAPSWAQTLDGSRYQGFNLIVGDWPAKQCHYLSNQNSYQPFKPLASIEYARSAIEIIADDISWGAIYGLSNAALDTPWLKTELLKTALQNSLAHEDAAHVVAHNLKALAQRDAAPDADLPRTGVSLELERALSSAFVSHPPKQPSYGTRTSTVALYQPGLGLQVTEVTHMQHSQPVQTVQTVQFQLGWL